MLKHLQFAANQRNKSVNTLLQDIIDYYLEIKKHESDIGLILLSTSLFKLIINSPPEELYERVRRDSHGIAESWFEVRSLKRDLPTLVDKIIKGYFETSGWCRARITNEPSGGYKILLMHELGKNWSLCMKAWLEGAYEYATGKVLPEGSFIFLENGLSVKFPP